MADNKRSFTIVMCRCLREHNTDTCQPCGLEEQERENRTGLKAPEIFSGS